MMNKTTSLILVFFFFIAGVKAQPEKTDYGNNPRAGHYANVNGIQLYYETYGSGEPLVMFHGNGGSINAFRNQIPFFEKHYRVIAIDSRLQGKSGGSPDTISYRLMVSDFNALMEQLHVDSAFVLGWSDGGIDGLLLAIEHPDKVKKLAISGANTVPDSTAVPYKDILDMRNFVEHDKKATPTVIALNKMMLYQPHISDQNLHTIKCPTLVMAGDHDIIKPCHTIRIFKAIPKAELCIFPDSNHGVCIQHPKEFNETVERFFRK
ncbi:alpha/beta fold hydrolase [Prolixibacter sp. NT017]|uniref:alpha/beta fold hydrolase n=1 Tax=Prolixibacter sp. NT017 TaxID=2652390 RepID=UPI0012889976|nr:alpha/beta hydrolase [Prolixibacter sp. NT017]GET24669.1 alpha/beta hydrolase [Prolixibacter sp. NT017]